MSLLLTALRDYRKGEKRAPNDLQSLTLGDLPYLRPSAAEKLTVDGWGRRLYYRATGEHFVLASFGRDGKADESISREAIGWSKYLDFDADIIVIDGEWASSPEGIGRE